MTEGKKSVSEHIESWLETSGNALELRTAQAFLKTTHLVQHSYHYVLREGGTREVDVVARYINGSSGPGSVEVRVIVVVECKSLKQPWVLYPADRRKLDADDSLYKLYLKRESKPNGHVIRAEGLHHSPIFQSQEHYYGIVDTNQQKDMTYAAVNQAWSAVAGVARMITSQDANDAIVTIVVPVVVTNIPLFSVRLRENGEPEIEPIERALLITRMGSHRGDRPVWVLNESVLEDFTHEIASLSQQLFFSVRPQ